MTDIRLHREIPRGVKTIISAFGGWSDAGDAATGSVEYLVGSRDAELLAEFDAEEFYDFTESRPQVDVDESGIRSLVWPQSRFFLARGTDATEPLLLFMGTEPNLRWRRFGNAFLDFAQMCGVEHFVTIGALLNAVPHTRKTQVNGTGGTPELQGTMQQLGIARTGGSYRGPTGVSSVLGAACQERGIPYTTFWGHVPHYIQSSPNPTVIHAILDNMRRSLGIGADLRELEGQAAAFHDRCEEALSQEPSMRAYVKRLEQMYDEMEEGEPLPDPTPSTGTPPAGTPTEFPEPDELVEHLENFLRQHRPPDTNA